MALDKFHENVKQALINDGWTITDDPIRVVLDDDKLNIDLGAEKVILAEKNKISIAIEVKSFIAPSMIYSFHLALGQFLNYKIALTHSKIHKNRILYLAVPADAYRTFFKGKVLVNTAIKEYGLKIMVFDPTQNKIEQWIK